MLYQVTLFLDGRYPNVSALADTAEDGSCHWVHVRAHDSAMTTLHVATREDAERLAALINEIVQPQIEKRAA